MKVSFHGLNDEERTIVEKLMPNAHICYEELESCEENFDAEILALDFMSKADIKVLERYKNLKAVISISTGYDNIDVEYCKKKGIRVYNIPDYGTETVAEFAVLLILAALRKLNQILDAMERDIYIDHDKLRGKDLMGKTVGIIGTGRIGSRTIKLLSSFGVKLIAYNRSMKKELVEKYGVEYVSLEELVKRADILSLHLPLTNETKHIIGEKELSSMKKGAIIVNTARGGLIDSEALAKHIDKHYYGLDVIEGEELAEKELDILKGKHSIETIKNAFIADILIKHPNAILTPHIAYNTHEAVERRIRRVVETIERIERGEECENRVA